MLLLVFHFLAIVVQSYIISGESCYYNYTDTSCSGEIITCYDMCANPDFLCNDTTCDGALIHYHYAGADVPGLDICYYYHDDVYPTYGVTTCVDDGVNDC